MITKTSPFDFTQGNLKWESSPTSLLSTSPSLPPLSVAIAAVAIAVATVVARAVATVPLPLPPLQNIRRKRDVNRIWPATNLGNLRADCLSCGSPSIAVAAAAKFFAVVFPFLATRALR